VSIFDQHTALLDVIELLGRNDGDVSNPGSVRRLVRGGLSNGRDWEKRRKYDGEYFHPKDPTAGHGVPLLCAVAALAAERRSVIKLRTKRGKSSANRILVD
jgi:hypothetical protein